MKIIGIIGLLAAIFITSQAAAAEMYSYTDQHGNKIYTDDISKLPVGQRPKTITKTTPAAGKQETSNLVTPGQKEKNVNLANELKQLEAIKEKLDEEFKALARENVEIKEEQKAAVTREQIKAVNRKAVSFNTRFKAYQEKEAVYKSRLGIINNSAKTTRSNSKNQ